MSGPFHIRRADYPCNIAWLKVFMSFDEGDQRGQK
jgi:hypothetical protein